MAFPPKKSTVVPTKTASPARSAPALGNRPQKKNPNAPKGAEAVNPRSGVPPAQSPDPEIPSDKPAAPGAEPKLMPEAEQARKGGMMARISPAPTGVLPEQPDGRTSYQVKPTDDTSPLIKIGPSKASPKADPTLNQPGIPGTSSDKTVPKQEPVTEPAAEPK
jgi:hypothetical protein